MASKNKMNHIIFVILFWLLALMPEAFAGYAYVRSITVQSAQISGGVNLTQFPILVGGNGTSPCNASISGLNQTGGGAHVQNPNGYDIIFTTDSACTNKLTWEMEKYVASTGEFEAWVTNTSTPLVFNSNTTFYMCYGNSDIAVFQSTVSSVWDSNFKGVWHFPNGTSLTANDSTINLNNGAVSGVSAAAGQIDGGASYVENSSNRITVPSSATLDLTNFTLSVWVKLSSTGQSSKFIMARTGGAGFVRYSIIYAWTAHRYEFYCEDYTGSNPRTAFGPDVNDTNFHHIVFTYNGTNLVGYLDGTQSVSNPVSFTITNGNNPLDFVDVGNTPGATLDEIKVSNTARSAGWIATEYNNQSAPSSFYTMGSENWIQTQSNIQGVSTIGGDSTVN